MDALGTKLRAARENKGWTIGQLAQHSGVDQGVISRVENGKKPDVSYRIIWSIADALELHDLRVLVPTRRLELATA